MGIVFDTWERCGYTHMGAGYRFRYPIGMVGGFPFVLGIVFDTWEIAGVSAKTVKVINGS